MGDWPSDFGGGRIVTGLVSNAEAVTVNTKGAWATVLDPCPYDAVLYVSARIYIGDCLYDIGIGAAGSEQVVMSNVLTTSGYSSGNYKTTNCIFPVTVPKGSRIAVRRQCSVNPGYFRIAIHPVPAATGIIAPLSSCTTIGDNTADSGGTAVDPGASALTKGSYVQLTAGLDRPVRAIILAAGDRRNATMSIAEWTVDIAIGAGNDIVVPDIALFSHSNSDTIFPEISMPFPVNIPAGEAISVRALCTITDATDRVFDAVLYCFS
jgi:hypothetical protein